MHDLRLWLAPSSLAAELLHLSIQVHVRVIIIGGGIIGLSAAYHLASRGCRKVIVLEKGAVGSGSSSRAAGIITGLLWDQTGVIARKKSLELFHQLSQVLDGYQFRNVGCLNLFDEQSWPARERLLPLYERLGAPFSILTAREVCQRWPCLSPRDGMIGLFDPLGGYSEPEELLPALARRCIALGVEIREGQQVRDLVNRSGRMCGVRTMRDEIEADAVICTVHSWTNPLLGQLGLRLPFKNFVHQRYLSAVLTGFPAIPAVNANPLNGYLRPASGNLLLAGIETPEREEFGVQSIGFDMSSLTGPAAEARRPHLQALMSLVPGIRMDHWPDEKVGLISFSLDGNPILGPVSAVPGLFVALGFHSGGFAYSPVAGLLLAEWLDCGRPSMDLSAFSPGRFNQHDAHVYLATMTAQKVAARRRH